MMLQGKTPKDFYSFCEGILPRKAPQKLLIEISLPYLNTFCIFCQNEQPTFLVQMLKPIPILSIFDRKTITIMIDFWVRPKKITLESFSP